MNILGVGFPELVLIFTIMLVVAGPKRMIQWAYTIGIYMGKLKTLWAETMQLVQQEIDQAGLDIEVPKDLPTRQNLNTWAQNTAKKYTASVEQELKRAQDVLDIPQDTFEISKDKPSWMPSATPPKDSQSDTKTTNPQNTFGNWGKPTSATQPTPAVANFGTWGEASKAPSKPTKQASADESEG